jgi:hypothetical protein
MPSDVILYEMLNRFWHTGLATDYSDYVIKAEPDLFLGTSTSNVFSDLWLLYS